MLQDEAVNKRIGEAFEAEGADAWYAAGARERFLGSLANEDWQKVDDILDVWFELRLDARLHAGGPAPFPEPCGHQAQEGGGGDTVMYLEGSDQHRGWFHSSLLESCGTRGVAPFDVVLTHGFVLDEHGRKMSKSLGNTVAPQDVMKQSGADILRMWVCASDYADDIRIGPEIIKTTVDTYRKLRNTLRWMLGNLVHFRAEDRVPVEKMPELERLMLHRLAELDAQVRQAYAEFDYKRIFAALNQFMTVDLSAFYFDIRKDALYCDPYSSVTRKAALTVIDELFRCTVTWLAPMLCFTAEEAWVARNGGEESSVHLELFPEVPANWRDDALAEKWRKVRTVRRVVTGALELERAAKRIGSSLEAAPDRLRVRSGAVCRAGRRGPCGSVDHLRRHPGGRRRGRRRRSGSMTSKVSPSCRTAPKVPSARARGRFRPPSAPIPTIPTSRRATPRRCASGTPCGRPRSNVLREYLWGPLTRFGVVVALIVCAIDQASKLWLLNVFDLANRGLVHITPFLTFVLTWNTGISYGLFPQESDLGRYVLLALKAAAVLVLWAWLARAELKLTALALGLIIGGAIGNAIDRVVYGAVVDFVLFHITTKSFNFVWYVFNLADAAIVAGVIGLLYDSFVTVRAAKAP